jgi:hypothetical protein
MNTVSDPPGEKSFNISLWNTYVAIDDWFQRSLELFEARQAGFADPPTAKTDVPKRGTPHGVSNQRAEWG